MVTRGDGSPLDTSPEADPAGFTVWLTGLSGAGKTTLADLLAVELRARGRRVEVLDGDVVRTNLSSGLGFSEADRRTNIARVGWVCEVLARNGIVAIAALISPYRDARDAVRARVGRFVEVHLAAPVEVTASRDVKGLYRQAAAGRLAGLTGVDDAYEPPLAAEVTCHSDGRETPAESAAKVIRRLEELGYLS
jgi:adenylylsulfate kinase